MSKRTWKKTNACRALDALSIPYEVKTYEVDEADLSAETVAAKVGLDPARVFKTLCVRADDKQVLLAVVPAGTRLDFKALARAADKKACAAVALKELTALTGYIRGGVTALACRKPYLVVVDESARAHEAIAVSAGVRGMQLLVSPVQYVRATSARWAQISVPA